MQRRAAGHSQLCTVPAAHAPAPQPAPRLEHLEDLARRLQPQLGLIQAVAQAGDAGLDGVLGLRKRECEESV